MHQIKTKVSGDSLLCILGRCAAIVFAGFLIFSGSAFAAPVNADTATSAVQGWLHQDHRPLGAPLSARVKRTEAVKSATGDLLYYVVQLDPSGFVILPADDAVDPVVAFSATGSFDAASKGALADMVKNDLPRRAARARAGATTASASKSRSKWHAFLAGSPNPPPDLEENNSIVVASQIWVAPFVQTLWNQSTDVSLNYACYNYYTPPGPPGTLDNDVCGCIATCMAQLMYYFQYPNTGVGTNTFSITNNTTSTNVQLLGGDGAGGVYQWGSMPLSPDNPTTSQAIAIGALTHDAGATVHMDYTPDDSSAYTFLAQQALTNTFKFANAAYYETGGSGISGASLLTMVNPNLDARLPVMLGINSIEEGGHCVLCDGYGYSAATLFYHVNAGWGGDDDIWYALPDIDTADNGDFSQVLACIYNIFTNGSGQIISGRVTDPTGAPVAGATIAAVLNGVSTNTATTDTNGIYALARIPAESTYALTVTNAGYNTNTGNYSTGMSRYNLLPSGNVWGANIVLSPLLLAIPETGFVSIGPTNGPFSVASTNYTLTNTSASSINWQISNTNFWLSVSSSNGTVAAGSVASLTVALTSAASSLPAGTYSGSILITNLNNGFAQQLTFSLSVETADYPIAVTGYNLDVVVESAAVGGNTYNFAVPFDPEYPSAGPGPVCFYEAGLAAYDLFSDDPAVLGLSPGGVFTSEYDHATTFQFGPYAGSNVLYLTSGAVSGSLAFDTPAAYQSLSVLAASAQGGGTGTLVIHFAGGATSSNIDFSAPNYMVTGASGPGAAITNFGLLETGNYNEYGTLDEEGTDSVYPTLYQTSINLKSLGLETNIIDSVTFTISTNVVGFTPGTVTGIFALSGTALGAFNVMVSASPSDGGMVSGGGAFLAGATNTVTAMTNNGFTFTNWTEGTNVVSTTTNYTFVVSNDAALVANFLEFFTITVSASTNNGGTVSGNATNLSGSSNTVTATPSNGFGFAGWTTTNGIVLSTSTNYTFVLNSNVTLVGNFLPLYTITVSASPPGDGTASGDVTNLAGSTNTVTATASGSFAFTNWTLSATNGTVESTSTNYTFVLNSNVTLFANFLPGFTVAASALPPTGGTVSGSGTFPANSTAAVTATAGDGYVLSNWTQGANAVSTSTDYSFLLDSNVTLVANFVTTPPHIGVFDGTNAITNNQTNAVVFSTVELNQTGSAVTFTVTNTGGQPLILSNITVPPGFSLNTNFPSTISNYPSTIAGVTNGTVTNATFNVQLITTTPGTNSGNIIITNNDPGNNPFTFPVTGIVLNPSPEIEVLNGTNVIANGQTAPVNFGIVLLNQTQPAITFTVTNTGEETLDLASMTVPAGFTVPVFPSAIAASGSGTFTLLLNTGAAGSYSGNITISNNSYSDSTFSFAVAGTVSSTSAVITVVASPAGGGTVGGGGTFPLGGTDTVTASANSGYLFTNWTTNGVLASTSNSYTFTTSSNETLVANFVPFYTLTAIPLPANEGTVSGGGTFLAGSLQTVTATPGNGYKFIGWTSNGTGSNSLLTVTVYTNLAVVANFAINATNITLTISVNGDGLVAPNMDGKLLKPGSSLTLHAVPGAGSEEVFSNWTGTITSTNNPLKISKIDSSLALQANFVPDPYPSFVGTYNGLFTATNGIVTPETAGMLKGLTLNSKGTYSGSILINGASKSIRGVFDLGGQASNSISLGSKEGNLEVQMKLTPHDPAPQVTGTVTGDGWVATNLVADRGTNSPLSPAYTLLIPPDTNNTSSPIGYGYALIAASSGNAKTPAAAKITGFLADGTAFSQSVPVSLDGYVPLYASLYSGKGLLLGWINLDNVNTSGTPVAWLHPVRAGLFTSAFTNIGQVLLSAWTDSPLTNALPSDLVVTETTDNIPTATNDFTLSISSGTYTFGKSPDETPYGSIASKTGLLKVTFGSGASKTTGYGVILPDATNGISGGGYFLTKTNSGALLLKP
jgi:hypothetical protein